MKTVVIAVIVPAILLLCSCGPVYRTAYDFTLPNDLRGRECINQCQASWEQCESNAIQVQQGCLNRAQQAYQTCESRKKYLPDPKKGWDNPKCIENCFSCYESYCSEPDLETCNSRYRDCYGNCGGIVKSKTECVAHCCQI